MEEGSYTDILIRSWHSSRAILYRIDLHMHPPDNTRATGGSEVDVVCASVDVLGVEFELFVEDIKRVQLSRRAT